MDNQIVAMMLGASIFLGSVALIAFYGLLKMDSLMIKRSS
jgi:nitrogen fixation-related uncharacterized protein